MQRLQIEHTTEYQFASPVTLLPHRILVRPRSGHTVRVASSKLEIEPAALVQWQSDALDNSMAIASFEPQGAVLLRIVSSVVIEHYEEAPLDFVVEDHAVYLPIAYRSHEALALGPFLARTWPDDSAAVESFLVELGVRTSPLQTYAAIDRMNRAIHDQFGYQAREERGVQTPSYTLEKRTGSCRDFAALLMEACRALGIASRFVSGYLDVGPNEVGAGATHAWTEVYLPGPGWKGFDPTIGELADTSHIPVAVALHPEDVPPVAGSFIGPLEPKPTMHVFVNVQRLDKQGE